MKIFLVVMIALALLAGVYAFQTTRYVLEDTQQVVVTQFGEPIEVVTTPGLHHKRPLIQKANYFPKNALESTTGPLELTTRDRTILRVVARTHWQITDPLRFFQRVLNEGIARSRLDQVIEAETREAVRSDEASTIAEETLSASVFDGVRSRTTDLGISILAVDLDVESVQTGQD